MNIRGCDWVGSTSFQIVQHTAHRYPRGCIIYLIKETAEEQPVAGMGSSAEITGRHEWTTGNYPNKAVNTRLPEGLQAWGPAVISPRVIVAEGMGPSYARPSKMALRYFVYGPSKTNLNS